MSTLSMRSGIRMPAEFDWPAEVARQAGWTICRCRSRHIQWKPPDGGPIIVTSSTPSEYRTIKNELARLRRAGLRI